MKTVFHLNPNSYHENIVIKTSATPEEAAKAIYKASGISKKNEYSVGVWLGRWNLLAAVEHRDGVVFARIVPALRDKVATPWRLYGET